jgi:hypothetical protein
VHWSSLQENPHKALWEGSHYEQLRPANSQQEIEQISSATSLQVTEAPAD